MLKEKILSEIKNTNGTITRVMTSHNINMVWVASFVALSILTYAFAWEKSAMQMCQESFMKATNSIARYNEENPKYPIPEPVYNCWTANLSTPSDDGEEPPKINLRDRFGLGDCRFINDSHRMGRYNLEWMAYDIACVPWQSFDVKSPWKYRLAYKWYGTSLWDYIILENIEDSNIRIVLWHIVNNDNQLTEYNEWDVIWQTNISWQSTGIHVHIELWEWYENVSREFALWEKYKSYNGTALLNHRKWEFWQQKDNVYYFTSYDLWDINQNDASPCIWASWRDLCQMERSGVRTMALTSDIRQKMGISFWDKVQLLWDEGCEGIFQVEDEMNKRFRQTPWILRPNTPYYIKGDLPSKKGWVCSITKI